MSDKPLVLEIPEELLERAQAAHIDLRRVVITALEKEVSRTQAFEEMRAISQAIQSLTQDMRPSMEDIEAEIAAHRREKSATN